MNGEKRGDAVADQWQERFDRERREADLALTELDVRAELKSMGEEETTDVIEREALERQRKKESDPPSHRGKMAVRILDAVKSPVQLIALLGAFALAAWWLWLSKG